MKVKMMMKKSLLGVLVSVAWGSAAMGGEVQVQKVSGLVTPMNNNFAQFENYTVINDTRESEADQPQTHLVDLRTPVTHFSQLGSYTVLEDTDNQDGILVSDVNYAAIVELPGRRVSGGGLFRLSRQCTIFISAASAPATDTARVYASNLDQYDVNMVQMRLPDGSLKPALSVKLELFLFADEEQETVDKVSCNYVVPEEEASELSMEVLSLNYINDKGYIPAEVMTFSVDSRELMLLTSTPL